MKNLITFYLAVILLSILSLSGSAFSLDQKQFPIENLKSGGYVVYFRHAKRDIVASKPALYALDKINSCKPGGALNGQGRDESLKIKNTIERLGIPVGSVYASPTCRTKQMAKITFGENFVVDKGIGPVWINKRKDPDHYFEGLFIHLSTLTKAGVNRFLVSHGGVLNKKTVGMKISLKQSDAAIFKPLPDSESGFEFVGIITKKEWFKKE